MRFNYEKKKNKKKESRRNAARASIIDPIIRLTDPI
jgi:hypothetical protein